MEEERKNTNSIYIVPELLEEIFLGLPLKSILKFKTVSKQWRSILESKLFVERRRTLQKNGRKILAAYNCNYCRRPSIHPDSRFEGDEEIVYLHSDAAQPSMTCDGLVCITEPGWFNVLNPSTGQIRRFPPGPDPVKGTQGNWLLGFGRDKVTGRYKIVRLCFRDFYEFGILDIETGEWSKLRTPPHIMLPGSKSVYVNGSIYWLQISASYIILALDLHKENYYGIHHLPATWVTQETQLVNLEDRLAMAMTTKVGPEWILEIWSMDIEEKGWSKNYSWSKTYSISLAHRVVVSWPWQKRWFTPVSVSKQGNLVFYDNHKRLFKYYSGTDETRCLSSNICVISSYVENLSPLPLKPSHTHPYLGNSDSKFRTSRCSLFPTGGSWISKVLRRNVLFTSLVVVGYIYLPL